ncbi:hypothetical protein FOMG_19379 [Fusarium oxysporum f. sp. melonis 26406]|uniref:Uncharacterized protein n=1 Tax=Fusarium oxysporum f. sp. melonis 26406 TaxID=1089452 RepID=W9YXG6_FUSOX|nr:hypothetical protein FOMG_19379 [Fusarium oxysporum f. sp. melonis 26406]
MEHWEASSDIYYGLSGSQARDASRREHATAVKDFTRTPSLGLRDQISEKPRHFSVNSLSQARHRTSCAAVRKAPEAAEPEKELNKALGRPKHQLRASTHKSIDRSLIIRQWERKHREEPNFTVD